MSTTCEQAIEKLELARRLALGSQFTTAKEKEINPNDGLVIRALKKHERMKSDIDTILKKWGVSSLEQLSIRIGKLIEKNNKLELRNEKWNEIYGKVINDLIDTRQLLSHLQKDLQTEKQDKTHIKKELDDALAILNKPTAEMGTQTDLTAEQISQMEKLLYEGSQEIGKLEREMETIRTEQTQKETEINQLKEQAKNTKLNPAEERIMKVPVFLYNDYKQYQRWIDFLSDGKWEKEVWDWKQLSKPFYDLRTKLIIVYQNLTKIIFLEDKLKKETEARNQLQTKYDMEVRSKEQVVKEVSELRKRDINPLLKELKLENKNEIYNTIYFYRHGVLTIDFISNSSSYKGLSSKENFERFISRIIERHAFWKSKILILGDVAFKDFSLDFTNLKDLWDKNVNFELVWLVGNWTVNTSYNPFEGGNFVIKTQPKQTFTETKYYDANRGGFLLVKDRYNGNNRGIVWK